MRLALRLSIVLVLGSAALLSAQAVLQAKQLVALNERELRYDLTDLAAALQDSAAAIWREAGEEEVRSYVALVDARHPNTRIRLVPRSKTVTARARLASGTERAGGADSGAALVARPGGILERIIKDDVLIVRAIIQPPSGSSAATRARPAGSLQQGLELEISRPLAGARARVRRIVREQTLLSALVVLALGALSLLMGLRLVGQRVQRLIEQARRVGAGDYTRNREGGRDELAALAAEMDQMVGRLEQSDKEIRAERLARSQALEQLRHADRLSTVGKLASAVAHELGTPLNVVGGRAQMIVDGAEPQSNAQIIVGQAEQMTRTIRQLLDFARKPVKAGNASDVDDLLGRATTLIEPLADDRGVKLDVSPSGGLEVAAEGSRVLQILTNLMVNGIQAMPDGGLLTIKARQQDTERPPDRFAAPGRYVRLDVLDKGVGIDEESLRHVFEPFFTTKGAKGGTGLGLSVCQDIVREHGGWIEVQSQPGRGSCFSVFLPSGGNA